MIQHNRAMGRRADPREPIWLDGPGLFAFLLDAGFDGPGRTDDGITYDGPGLRIVTRFVGGHEPEFATDVLRLGQDGAITGYASLGCLYVACRCGVLQDVPSSVDTQRTAAKRVRQHADALRRLLPHLLRGDPDDLIRRCRGRLLPGP
jgi:hypothetical protein